MKFVVGSPVCDDSLWSLSNCVSVCVCATELCMPVSHSVLQTCTPRGLRAVEDHVLYLQNARYFETLRYDQYCRAVLGVTQVATALSVTVTRRKVPSVHIYITSTGMYVQSFLYYLYMRWPF